MRYPFCHTIKDELLGIETVYDIEVELVVSVEIDGGVPILSVDAVYKDGKNLFAGTPLTKSIASEIALAAEDDDDLLFAALADENIAYVGRGGNDPDGRYVRRSF